LVVLLPTSLASFARSWNHDIAPPYTPLSVGISCPADMVAVGSRDCPDNTANQLDLVVLSTGNTSSIRNDSVSNMAVAHQGDAAGDIILAGVGWVKADAKTELAEVVGTSRPGGNRPSSWSKRFHGDPAMWIPSAISGDGVLSALLVEPVPDEAHLNNRSGELLLFRGTEPGPDPVYRMDLEGLGPMDPQSVAVSSRGKNGTYAVGVLVGAFTVIVDYDTVRSKGTVVHREIQGDTAPEFVLAVSSSGDMFAVADGATLALYERSAASGAHRFTLRTRIDPPYLQSFPAMSPSSFTFSDEPAASPLLAAAWVSQDGGAVAVSAYTLSQTTTSEAWSHVQPCSAFNMASSRGLSVSSGGEWVAFGSWGCDDGSGGSSGTGVVANSGRQPNIGIWAGIGGDGKPVFQDVLPGEIWAVDVQACTNASAVVAVGSWITKTAPSQLTVYAKD